MLLSNRTRRMMWFLSSLSVADYDDGPNYDSLACAILFLLFCTVWVILFENIREIRDRET